MNTPFEVINSSDPVQLKLGRKLVNVRPSTFKNDPRNPAVGKFGKYEIEITAGRLILFFKEVKGSWTNFTLDELRAFYIKHGWNPNGMLFGLVGPYFDDGTLEFQVLNGHQLACFCDEFAVTRQFLQNCVENADLDIA